MKIVLRLMLIGAVALNAGAGTNTAKGPVLKGTVVDGAGRPVEDATIESFRFNWATDSGNEQKTVKDHAVADTNGAFRVVLARYCAVVLARKPGLATAWRQFWNVRRDIEQQVVLTPPGVLAGTVVDEADKPVANAEVFVLAASIEMPSDGGGYSYSYLNGKPARELFSASTSADGRFRIEGFPTNASANLWVQAPGKALLESPQQSFGPELLPYRAGQEDIRLVVEPAGSIEGRITVAGADQPLPVATLTLQPETPGMGAGARGSVKSDPDGSFRIPDVGAGNYRIHTVFGHKATRNWVAEPVSVSVETGQTTRNVEIPATRGGVLKVTVLGKTDRKPQANVFVNAYRESYQADAKSDPNGVALLRLPAGEYQVNAFRETAGSEQPAVTVEAGKTNLLEIELPEPAKIKGVVRGLDGQPAAGLEVRVVGGFGPGEGSVKTDANGEFELDWNPRQYGGMERSYCILIRDPARNLAVAQDIDEDTGPLDLQLAPALTIAGRAECEGKPITNATAALVFWAGNTGMHLPGFCVGTNKPGHFEIPALPPGRRYGVYVSAPGYGQKGVHDIDSDEAKRVEIDPVELKPANLKLAGQVLDADEKPVPGTYVNLHGEGQPNANVRTDREGRFNFDHICEGSVQLYANARNSHGSVSAEGGDTNVVLRLGETYSSSPGGAPRKLSGVVTDPAGKPAVGAQVAVFPFSNSRWVRTDTNGAFNLRYAIQEWQLQSGGDPWLVVRDKAHNLAGAETISEGVTNLNVQLQPAVTVTGRVEGPDGSPLTNAQISIMLVACRSWDQFNGKPAGTDAHGNFEIKNLAAGPQYMVFASAKDHGQKREELEPDATTNRVTLPTFVLKIADQIVMGQVVNAEEKPVSGVQVSLSGEDQPNGSATTDSKGLFKFKVCEGEVRLYANGQNSYANASVTAGDTNVILQLTRHGYGGREAPRRPSLKGKPLPDLASVGLAGDAAPAGQPLLLCLLDAEQRPSRHVARQLAQRHDALKQKGVSVAVIQVRTSTSAETFQEWTNSTPMPFPVASVEKNSPANKWATSVTALPWLILRDTQGTVAAEGFPLDELDAKLDGLKK